MLARLWGAANVGHDSCEAASSTEGANHDIMSARESEEACSLLANGEIME